MKHDRRITAGWLLRLSRRYYPVLFLLTLLNVARGMLMVRFALASRTVIDSAVAGDGDAFRAAVLRIALIIASIVAAFFLSNLLSGRTSASMEKDWKARWYRTILHSDFSAASAYHSGDLLNRITSDVHSIAYDIVDIVPSLSFVLSRMIGAVAALAGMEPRFTLVLACGGVLIAFSVLVVRDRMKDLYKRVQASNGRLSGFLQETIGKLLMIQCTNVEEEVEARAEVLLQENWDRKRDHRLYSVSSRTSVLFLCFAAEFAALLWCSSRLMVGAMTFGTLTAVIQLVGQLEGPFANIARFLPQYITMIGSGERLRELEKLALPEEGEPKEPDEVYGKARALCAEGVCFSYGQNTVLNNVTFAIPRNAMAVITGSSGIGKSTLLKLMLGVYRPRSGSLYVDGGGERIPLGRDTRRLFAYVPQGNLLLSGTLRDNLCLTNPKASEEEIWAALELSELAEVIRSLPKGLDTQIGENAAGLSEGQAQRLSIARALISGAPILLLDEITSALDEQTEYRVLKNLTQLPEKTILAVTHRPAALALADCQIVLSETGAEVRPCQRSHGAEAIG